MNAISFSKDNFSYIGVILFLIITFTSLSYPIISKSDLSGIVIDSETSKPVANAVIQILNSDYVTTSRDDGTFKFISIEEGSYQLKVTHLSYQEKLIQLDLQEYKSHQIVIYLGNYAKLGLISNNNIILFIKNNFVK